MWVQGLCSYIHLRLPTGYDVVLVGDAHALVPEPNALTLLDYLSLQGFTALFVELYPNYQAQAPAGLLQVIVDGRRAGQFTQYRFDVRSEISVEPLLAEVRAKRWVHGVSEVTCPHLNKIATSDDLLRLLERAWHDPVIERAKTGNPVDYTNTVHAELINSLALSDRLYQLLAPHIPGLPVGNYATHHARDRFNLIWPSVKQVGARGSTATADVAFLEGYFRAVFITVIDWYFLLTFRKVAQNTVVYGGNVHLTIYRDFLIRHGAHVVFERTDPTCQGVELPGL